MSPSSTDVELLTSLFSSLDAFERTGILGEGGTAVVYRARHRETGAAVALKLLRTGALDPSWSQRFAREARAVSALRHPNIARVVGHGQHPEGLYIAFELIDGGTLLELKERMGGTLPVPVAVEVLAQLLAALEYAHAAGTIHRDIKPGNIMLTSEGVVKLVDFGIARAHDDVPLTQTGAIIGTAAFMSPEQVEGDAADERSDLFSVGLVLTDMIVGESPFLADSTAATIMRLMREEVPLLAEGAGGVPWALERIHSKLVDRERERRPIGADLVLEELKPLVRAGRDRWPRLLADAVARPAETAAQLRRDAALAELQRAQALCARHGSHPSAVLAVHEAVRIDPSLDEAAARLRSLQTEACVVVERKPDDDAVREVSGGLGLQPRQAVLWRRLADLHRLRGESFHESIALKRVLRLRRDPDADSRLRQLAVGPDDAARSGLSQEDANDPTTTSVQTPTRSGARPGRFAGTAPWFFALALATGALVGVGATLLGSAWLDPGSGAVEPAPAVPIARRPAAHELSLRGLTASLGPAQTSLLSATGPVRLGGRLEVELSPGYVPAADATFVILRAGSIDGAFADGARAAARPRGTFDVEVTGSEVMLVRYDPDGAIPFRDGPSVELSGPAVLGLWGVSCPAEVAAWPSVRATLPADARVVHVTRPPLRPKGLARALAAGLGDKGGRRGSGLPTASPPAASPPIAAVPMVDADGARFFLPLGVSGCAIVLVDAAGRARLRTTPTTPGAGHSVRRAWEALTTEVPFLTDTTASVGERVQRLRACLRLTPCAAETVTAWTLGAPLQEADVDACLLGCDPGAVPRAVVLAAARAALDAEEPDRALRLLEPWRASPFADMQRALGDAYLKAHALEEARTHYRRYLELAPDAPDAAAVRRELAP